MRRFLLLALLALPTAARSQIFSAYVTSANSHFTGVQTSTVVAGTSSTSANYATSDFWTSGVGGGVTLGVLPVGPIHIGLDLRGSTRPGVSGADTAMAGLRVGLKPPIIRIKPYVQASGGYVGTRTPDLSAGIKTTTGMPTFNNRYAAWEILGGVDYPLLPFVDFRVVEFGGGRGYAYSSTTALNLSLTSGPQISLFTVNTGLVVHF